ncbi:MFS transporter [bacterium]|nr:MFS transporter [bacterium]
MFKAIGNYFKVPEDIPVIQDEQEVAKKYKRSRIEIFLASFLGYTVFHLTRKNIGPALPMLSQDLGYSNLQLGILGSSLYFTYAFGKFINGVIADKADAKKFMTAALFMSALSNILFGLSPYIIPKDLVIASQPVLLLVLAFFWGVNGWFQSMGFPGIAKALAFWYSNKERGTVWSFWSTSHQFGTMLGAVLAGFIIAHFGWRAAFIIPGIINLGMCFMTYKLMKDKPTTQGLPEVEMYREGTVPTAEEDAEADLSYMDILKKYIFFNKTIWILAIAYIFVYICRYGTEDWIVKYLVEVRGDDILLATQKFGSLAFFGILGAISAGFISDKVFKGKRTPVNIIFLLGVVASVYGIMHNSYTGSVGNIIDSICLAGMGFCVAGPQMLVGGLCAVESGSKKVASAATGFCGIFGYLGAIGSGAGTGWFIDHYGWDGALWFWIVSAFICIAILTPLLAKKV